MERIVKMSIFALGFFGVYCGTIFILANIYYGDQHERQLFENAIGNKIVPGGYGQTLRRFREIEGVEEIDILFMGSSHAYRGFDPRIFAEHGYTSYNIGSSAQTPLNGYYLARRYLRRLKPKLVILEVSPVVLGKDGVESVLDLAVNVSFSKEMLEMAVAVKNPQAVNAVLGAAEGRLERPLRDYEQQDIANERYIAGGYCETLPLQGGMTYRGSVQTIVPLAVQMDYVKKTIEYVKAHKAEMVLVTQPVPREYVEDTINYRDVTGMMYGVSREYGISYYDFNNLVSLDARWDFLDKEHLSASGVRKYNEVLAKKISGYGRG